MKFKLYGDIIRAGVVEIEADGIEDLNKMLEKNPLILDDVKFTIIDELKRDPAFSPDGTIFDENDNEIN